MKWNLLGILVLLLICGCGRPTRLEQTSLLLKAGMNKSQVKHLFAEFPLIGETDLVVKLTPGGTEHTYFGTNKQCATMLVYKSNHMLSYESCMMYFSTNVVII